MKHGLCACVAAGVWLLTSTAVGALDIREGFEWDWSPACTESAVHSASCFEVAGCENGRALFVRRTNPGRCDYSDQVRFWQGRPASLHAPRIPPALEDGGGENAWVASHIRDPGWSAPNDDTFEILTSRAKQSSRFGSLQVDLHVPEDVPVSGGGEHYLIMHNLNLSPVVPCPRDGDDCPADAGSNVGGVPGNPSSYEWYGVIAGAFGAGTEAIPYGSVGFAIEVSAQGRGGNYLIDESFLPYSVAGEQQSFPAGKYRVRIERALRDGEDVYEYSVQRWNETAHAWSPLVPDGQRAGAAGGGAVRVPFARLLEPIGAEIPTGYVGLTAAWFGAPTQATRHIDWDNLITNW